MTKLKILAEDIMNYGYYNSSNCPITRALQRAGFENYEDHGVHIKDTDGTLIISSEEDKDLYDENYKNLVNRVISMYAYKHNEKPIDYVPEEPKDFEVELPI